MDELSIASLSDDRNIQINIRDKLKQILIFLKEKREDLIVLKARYECMRTTWETKELGWERERKALQDQIDVLKANVQDRNMQVHFEVQKNIEFSNRVQMLEEQVLDLTTASLQQMSEIEARRKKERDVSSKMNKMQSTVKRAQAEKCVMLRKCMDLETHQRELELWASKLSDYATRVHGHNQALHQQCEKLFSVLGRLRLDDSDGDTIELQEIKSCVETLSKEQESEPPEKEEVASENLDESIELPEDDEEALGEEEESLRTVSLEEIMEVINSNSEEPEDIESSKLPVNLSVSQVFLRLHTLTLQKNALVKDLDRYKILNTQLHRKVQEHEQKILNVKTELQTTWGLVTRLKQQHDKLHTSELILKYDLHEKRLLLNRLKEELEYSREQWKTLQRKNDASAREWKSLREEFARRKHADSVEDGSQSTEDSTCQSPTGDSAAQLDSDGTDEPVESNTPLICYALVSYDNPGFPPSYM